MDAHAEPVFSKITRKNCVFVLQDIRKYDLCFLRYCPFFGIKKIFELPIVYRVKALQHCPLTPSLIWCKVVHMMMLYQLKGDVRT